MKRLFQKFTIGVVLHVVYAALVELYRLDSRARKEMDALPEGMSYSITTGHKAPVLNVQWQQGKLSSLVQLAEPVCSLRIKSLAHSFRLFTGQMGLAQAYACHAFSMRGEIADVMKLARMVNLVEGYLFPPVITRRILVEIPPLQVSSLRVYAAILCGFLSGRYKSL